MSVQPANNVVALVRPGLFRPYRFSQCTGPTGTRRLGGWRLILPVWWPRFECFYDISDDMLRYGVRVDTIALSWGRDARGFRLGIDWGPFELGQWTPGAASAP